MKRQLQHNTALGDERSERRYLNRSHRHFDVVGVVDGDQDHGELSLQNLQSRFAPLVGAFAGKIEGPLKGR